MAFDYDPYVDDVIFPYGQDIKDQNTEEVVEVYVEALDEYIGTHAVLPGKYSIPVLTKVIGRKRDHPGNLAGDRNKNPTLDTIIYEIEFPYGNVE